MTIPPVHEQLPLRLAPRAGLSFRNFLPAGNEEAFQALREGREQTLFLWGANGSGKSHLLQALCAEEAAQGVALAYLPLGELKGAGPELLEGLEGLGLVCIDDCHLIAGDKGWEIALFHLFNAVREGGGRWVATALLPPAALGISLPDLSSRLGWGPVFQLHPLDDREKGQALRMRADERGLSIPDEVIAYLFARYSRDMNSLLTLLDRLDVASLAEQRRLTVPFVRRFTGGGEGG